MQEAMPGDEEPTAQEPVTHVRSYTAQTSVKASVQRAVTHVRHATAKKSVKASVAGESTAKTARGQARRGRGRYVGSLNHTEEYRRAVVLEYHKQRRRGIDRWVAADLVGLHYDKLHKPDTIEKWAKQLGIDGI